MTPRRLKIDKLNWRENTLQELQEKIDEYIPVGRKNAISRKQLETYTGSTDRMNRIAIQKSEAKIINIGNGYYIPDMNDPVDVSELQVYLASEYAKAMTSINKLMIKFGDIATPDAIQTYIDTTVLTTPGVIEPEPEIEIE